MTQEQIDAILKSQSDMFATFAAMAAAMKAAAELQARIAGNFR